MCDTCGTASTDCTLPDGLRVCRTCATVYFQALLTCAVVHTVEVTLTPQGSSREILSKVSRHIVQSFNEACAFSAIMDAHKEAAACGV